MSFGATADGKTIDTPAVNRAISAAAAAGSGTVHFGAGVYVCYSIRLKSFVTLYLEPGAIILAAPGSGYDAAESNAPFEPYQDFGHNHWHNSLIRGEGIHDVAIFGPGLICGRGLSRGEVAEQGLPRADAPGAADKAIALKRCHNVTVRDIAILAAGHFGILATGVDNLTLEDLKIDTNRDGINVDCCRNVRISKCSVNSPWDDGICLKSSFALGEARATENVTISDCYLTGGFALGAMLDGTFRRTEANAGQPTGRIKCGTESNGGFRNITITNCVFETCRGFALETVDGGPIEDITFAGVTMRDIRNAPFFLRLGARLRGPAGTSVGTFKRVRISNIMCEAPANDMPAIIAGIPAHPIEDVSISDVLMVQKGGASASLADIDPPEQEREYPEPSSFGPLPACGLLVRHAKNVEFHHIEINSIQKDARPFVWLSDVDGADFSRLSLSPLDAVPALRLREIRNLLSQGAELRRSDLSRLLFEKIRGGTEVIFGDEILGLQQHADRVQVRFQYGNERSFDLVIGADGLHSSVRRLVFGSQDRFEKPLGYVVAAFEVQGYRSRDEDVYVIHSEPGRMLGRFALRDDRTLFLFVFAADVDRSPPMLDLPTQKALLRKMFGDGKWECARILGELDCTQALYFDRVSQIKMGTWWRGRVALVGDAAFCVSLMAGQGSALAMTSAYVLAGELAKAIGRHEEAFGNYEMRLRAYISSKQKGAERFSTAFAPKTCWGLFLRNQVIKACAIPGLARLTFGRDIVDTLQLPDYGWSATAT